MIGLDSGVCLSVVMDLSGEGVSQVLQFSRDLARVVTVPFLMVGEEVSGKVGEPLGLQLLSTRGGLAYWSLVLASLPPDTLVHRSG
jgi:hypothetical protein